jgi:hypothetical protein
VVLHAGEQLELSFCMVIGERSEIVIVGETFGVLQTETAQIKDVTENQQVVNLPVKDREFLELALVEVLIRYADTSICRFRKKQPCTSA